MTIDRDDIGTLDYFIRHSYFDLENQKYVYAFPNVSMQSVHVVELVFDVAKIKLWRSFSPKEFNRMIDKRFRALREEEKANVALCFAGST
jgi:hypothetical protein